MILVRHVTGLCLTSAALCTLLLCVVGVTVRVVEQVGVLAQHGSFSTLAAVLAAQFVVQFYDLAPIAAFVGCVVAAVLLARRGELTGMQAVGLSEGRLNLIALGVVAGVGLGTFGAGETLVPGAHRRLQELYTAELGKGLGRLGSFFAQGNHWFSFAGNVLYLPRLTPEAGGYPRPVYYRFEGARLVETIDAAFLGHEEGRWRLREAVLRGEHGARREQSVELDLPLGGEDFARLTGNPRHLSLGGVAELVDRRRAAGLSVAAHRSELIRRLYHPWLGIWMLLLGSPWLFWARRRPTLARSMAGAVVIITVVTAFAEVLRLAGLGHTVPTGAPLWGLPAGSVFAGAALWRLVRRS